MSRVIYIKNPSSGSHFRRVSGSGGGVTPPNVPDWGSPVIIKPPKIIKVKPPTPPKGLLPPWLDKNRKLTAEEKYAKWWNEHFGLYRGTEAILKRQAAMRKKIERQLRKMSKFKNSFQLDQALEKRLAFADETQKAQIAELRAQMQAMDLARNTEFNPEFALLLLSVVVGGEIAFGVRAADAATKAALIASGKAIEAELASAASAAAAAETTAAGITSIEGSISYLRILGILLSP